MPVLILLTLVATPFRTHAWGRRGHSLIAEIAFHYLDENTKKQVLDYLGGLSIEQAANWMDDMRSDPSYDFMKPYHYVNFEKGAEVVDMPGDNIIGVLEKTIRDFDHMGNLSHEEIKTRILYLFHLVGDLHQPLHVGYLSDRGGNQVMVTFFEKNTNLHAVWDTEIIEYKATSLEQCLADNSYNAAAVASIEAIDILGWTRESRRNLDRVYAITNNHIDQDYVNINYPVIEKQLLKAGLRLASLLRHYFRDLPYKPGPATETPIASAVTIDIKDAPAYEGKLVKICAAVYDTKYLESSGRKPTFLNLGAPYPNAPLTILIWGDSRTHFSQPPERYYQGKNICVTGRVTIYKGKPEIIVDQQKDIEVQ